VTFGANPRAAETAVTSHLKIWVHRVTPEQDSQGIPAQLAVHRGGETRHVDLELSRGQVVLPLTHAAWRVEITLHRP